MVDQKQTKSQWFDRLESPLLHYAHGILRNDDAQDVVQDVFIRFFRVTESKPPLRHWLYKTTRQLMHRYSKKTSEAGSSDQGGAVGFFVRGGIRE